MMTRRRDFPSHPLAVACVLAALLCPVFTGCEKESQAIVSIALHPTNANILYVATNDAVYKSRDEGSCGNAFRVSAQDGDDARHRSSVPGHDLRRHSWPTPLQESGWRATLAPHNVGLKEHVSFINQFVFHPTDHDQIYAATTVGAFYTKDGGREWEERMAGMKEVHIVVSIAIHPRDPRVLYAGTTGESIGRTAPGWGGRKSTMG